MGAAFKRGTGAAEDPEKEIRAGVMREVTEMGWGGLDGFPRMGVKA
jgi:hypothetical protein